MRYCVLLSEHERERRAAGPFSGPTVWSVYDVVTGLSGAGRYLLLRGDSAAAGRAARALVSVCAPVGGTRGPVPGWWAGHSPREDAEGVVGVEGKRRVDVPGLVVEVSRHDFQGSCG
ncbi:hypothetical protein ABZ442_25115 [Streptomyces triculaminicus]|uniref:hypothetical protein n=1 Tax=Streptomyces triculaminicus TaxID=2816232 RepID=UPI0033E68C54